MHSGKKSFSVNFHDARDDQLKYQVPPGIKTCKQLRLNLAAINHNSNNRKPVRHLPILVLSYFVKYTCTNEANLKMV